MCGEAENNDEEKSLGINVQPFENSPQGHCWQTHCGWFGLALQLCRKTEPSRSTWFHSMAPSEPGTGEDGSQNHEILELEKPVCFRENLISSPKG